MRFISIIFFILIIFYSCATTGNYEKILKSWVGQKENELISSWGAPTNIYELSNGSKLLTWYTSSESASTTTYNSFLNTYHTQNYRYWCKTTMTVNSSGTITNWRWEGNSCKSY